MQTSPVTYGLPAGDSFLQISYMHLYVCYCMCVCGPDTQLAARCIGRSNQGERGRGKNDKCESSRHATAGDTLRDSSHQPRSAALYSSELAFDTLSQKHTMRG